MDKNGAQEFLANHNKLGKQANRKILRLTNDGYLSICILVYRLLFTRPSSLIEKASK